MSNELLAVASSDGSVRMHNAQDGSSRWIRSCGHHFEGPALVQVADSIIALALDGYLCALAVEDGAVRWEMLLPDATPISTSLAGLRVAANGDNVVIQHGSQFFGVDPSDGHILWKGAKSPLAQMLWLLAVGKTHVYTLQREIAPAQQSPLDSGLTEPSDDPRRAGALRFVTTAFSAWDGTPQWWTRDQSAIEPPWDGAPPLVEADGVVYVYGQGLHALDAASGRLLWTQDAAPSHHVGALAIEHDHVVVAAGGHLGVYRRDTGVPLWSETGKRRDDGYYETFDGLLTIGDVIYAGRGEFNPRGYRMEARVGETGALRWSWPADSSILRPDVAWRFRGKGTTLYVPSIDGLWSIRASDGMQLWRLAYTFGFDALLAVEATNA